MIDLCAAQNQLYDYIQNEMDQMILRNQSLMLEGRIGGRISDPAQITAVVVATACEPSRVGVFAEGQPIACGDVLRRRLTEPWLQERITDDQL